MPVRNRVDQTDRLFYERSLLEAGHELVVGIDEAGRGPLAGPVVAAAVILPGAWIRDGMPEQFQKLNDSKQLSSRQRDLFFELLTTNSEITFAIAECDAVTIDKINILQATHLAMNRAIAQLAHSPDHALVDGRPVNSLAVAQTALVKGDSLSYSIAAASVLAKVTRDRQMLEWHERHPEYGFAGHKGYGTAAHLAALTRHGPCPIHRRSFAPVSAVQGELFGDLA